MFRTSVYQKYKIKKHKTHLEKHMARYYKKGEFWKCKEFMEIEQQNIWESVIRGVNAEGN